MSDQKTDLIEVTEADEAEFEAELAAELAEEAKADKADKEAKEVERKLAKARKRKAAKDKEAAKRLAKAEKANSNKNLPVMLHNVAYGCADLGQSFSLTTGHRIPAMLVPYLNEIPSLNYADPKTREGRDAIENLCLELGFKDGPKSYQE